MGFRIKILRSLCWFVSYISLVLILQVYVLFNVPELLHQDQAFNMCNQRHESLVARMNVIADRQHVFEARRQKLREVCSKFGLIPINSTGIASTTKLFWNPNQNFAFCPTGKSGSISWSKFLWEMSGMPFHDQDMTHEEARFLKDEMRYTFTFPTHLSASIQHEILNAAFTFTFVSHPFVRLVGYYDVLVGNVDRAETLDWFPDSHGKTTGPLTEGNKPTFSNFVDYFIANLKFDPKASTTLRKCEMCALNYDVIAKMDTYNEDRNFILAQTNLDRVLHVKQVPQTEDSAYQVALEFFAKLSREQILKLVDIYQMDFEAFSYNFDEFLSKAQ
ncbi:hypothetical protein TCAL_08620 [Tigriopus californicus]|uniref:Carbohydrate sulfotransferase n=1 Tax=Tigriopus californicus TaxID=6832 RepID=A0A553PJU6_TIGCA|nr:carbohydrate sulfotransferase 11-like [Tigriopus californicus]TRY77960.1 hypothetical protein TCAL_08620 [Tigriopus californicus]|eukprot:TCALIF_08620-PA protein Name:"Similar to chst10 Carbohydrate sulfotransferase 10 (Xenopus laevis)" AED:0.11 eAED:0.11 QI:0/-1/0/1/-1/1/1/0/331